MKNLLNSTDIATVFLDDQLRIKRYTEQAKKVIRLIPTDVGRPIGDLVSSLHYDRLVEDAREVLRTLVYKEIEIRGEDAEWYLLRMIPYRTTDNVIDGLVLTFVDVTKVKALQAEQGRLLEVLQSSPVTVFGQDRDFRFTWACSSVFGRDREELLGKTDGEIFARDDAARLADLKNRVLRTGAAERHRLDLTPNESRETYDFYVEPEHAPDGGIRGVACVATNLTNPGDGESTLG
jgi:two-component system CheB/CheR fusion protein